MEVERIAPGGQPWGLVHRELQRLGLNAKGLVHHVHDLLERWAVIQGGGCSLRRHRDGSKDGGVGSWEDKDVGGTVRA